MKLLFTYILAALSFSANAQVRYGGLIDTYKGVRLFQDDRNKNAFYYLPEAPRIQKENGVFKFHLTKYLNEDKTTAGGIFSASFDFLLSKEEINSIENYLRIENRDAFIKHQLPLYSFEDNPKYGKASFKIETGILSNSENIASQVVFASEYIPLQSGGSFSMLIHLDEKQTSLLEETLQMGTTDLSAVVQGYYPAISPELNIQISIASKYGYDEVKRKVDNNKGYINNDEGIENELNKNRLFKIKILSEESLNKDVEDLLAKLVIEKLVDEMLEPTSICPQSRASCFRMKNKTYTPSDSLYIALTKSEVRNVPVILSGNLNFVADSTFQLRDYVSVVNLVNSLDNFQQVDFKINEQYLGAFEEYLGGVSIMIRRDTLGSSGELALNWIDIKTGVSSKSTKIAGGANGNRKFQYKLLWNYAKADTLISTSWIDAYKPFISIAPPLDKKRIDIIFDGSVMPNVEQVLIDFAAKLGNRKKAQIIESTVMTNTGNLLVESLDCYTDFGSEVVYRTIHLLKNNETKIFPPQKLDDSGLVNMTKK